MKKIYLFSFLVACALVAVACKKDTKSTLIAPITVSNLDANNLVLYSFRTNSVIPAADSTTSHWDIAFKDHHIRVNGGQARAGAGGGFIYITDFDTCSKVPSGRTFGTDSSNYELAIPSGLAGSTWYSYNAATGIYIPIYDRILMIRTGDGNKYAKVKITSYYKNAPNPPTSSDSAAFYTFQYVYQPNGSQSFTQ